MIIHFETDTHGGTHDTDKAESYFAYSAKGRRLHNEEFCP